MKTNNGPWLMAPAGVPETAPRAVATQWGSKCMEGAILALVLCLVSVLVLLTQKERRYDYE